MRPNPTHTASVETSASTPPPRRHVAVSAPSEKVPIELLRKYSSPKPLFGQRPTAKPN
jgi:hypothetical protein